VACHGIDAQGTRSGPALAGTPLSARDVINITRRGGPGMPKYPASQIGDQEIQDMYAWFQNPTPAATAGGQPTAGAQPTVAVQPTVAAEALWVQAGCGACHGASGEGGTAPALRAEGLSFDRFQRVVRQGARGMPAYGVGQISDGALQSIYDWLQGRAQAPGAPLAEATPQTPADAQALWAQVGCGACHGANAQGGSAPGLAGEGFSYERFQRVVRRGEEGMPAYSTAQISGADLQRLYDWLRALP
jgi:mono/diheme cytochrome c family protein